MESPSNDPKAQQRMQVILTHLAGQINATEAAQTLNISRKTFYLWLDRARAGMLGALADRPTGRPGQPVDPQQMALLAELERLAKERSVLEGRLRIQEAIREVLNLPADATKKNVECERMIAAVQEQPKGSYFDNRHC